MYGHGQGEIAFIVINVLFQRQYSHLQMVECICHIYRTEELSIEQEGDQQNRMAFDRTEWLLIDQNGYGQIRMAIDRTEQLSIKQNGY